MTVELGSSSLWRYSDEELLAAIGECERESRTTAAWMLALCGEAENRGWPR